MTASSKANKPKKPTIDYVEKRLLANAIVTFTKNGGITVFGVAFPGNATPPDFNDFFENFWALPRKFGDYVRTTLVLNKQARLKVKGGNHYVADQYSMKAVHVKGIAQEDLLYVTDANSVRESFVFGPEKINTNGSGPAVVAQYGHGRIGYLGNVNNEEESQVLLFAMLSS